jgi:hypothetical protein
MKERNLMPSGNGSSSKKPIKKKKASAAKPPAKNSSGVAAFDPKQFLNQAETAVGKVGKAIGNAYANRPATKIFQGMGGKNGKGK